MGAELYILTEIDSGFPHLNPTTDFKKGTLVATLSGLWPWGVSSRTGWHGVSKLGLGVIASVICNFYLSVAGYTIA